MTRPILLTLTQSSIPGGVESYSQLLRKTIPALEIMGRERLPPNAVPRWTILREPETARLLAQQVHASKEPPSLVLANGLMGWAIPSIQPAIPMVSILHGTYAGLAEQAYSKWDPLYWRMRWAYAHYERKTAQSARVCVANSEHTAAEAQKYYGVSPRVVELPIDTAIFHPRAKNTAQKKVGWDPRAKNVLFVGNPTSSKGFDIFVDLAARHPEYVFHAITVPRASHVRSNLRTYDPVSPQTLAEYYAAADALIFSSRYEGFGLVPLEALACGTPVIAGNVGVLSSIHAPSLRRVAHHDSDHFDRALVRVLNEQPETKAAIQLIKTRFTHERFAHGIQAAIREAERGFS